MIMIGHVRSIRCGGTVVGAVIIIALVINFAGTIRDNIQFLANIATLLAASGVVVAFVAYVVSRVTSRGYYGITDVIFSPPESQRSYLREKLI